MVAFAVYGKRWVMVLQPTAVFTPEDAFDLGGDTVPVRPESTISK